MTHKPQIRIFINPCLFVQRDQSFQEQQMANLPSSLMTTAAKADKKPFSYTPVGK